MVTKPAQVSWGEYLDESALDRLQAGERICQAFEAGLSRQEIGLWMGCSAAYVSRLAALARDPGEALRRIAAVRALAEAARAALPHAPYTGVSWQRLLEILDGPATATKGG